MDDQTVPKTEYGVTPIEVMASMAGIDFVRAIFGQRLPQPPIMQTIEPFDCTADPGLIVMHSVPGLRHYNPIGSVHSGYAATLLDSAMGLAVHSLCPAGSGYTTPGIQGVLHQGDDQGHRRRAHRGPHAVLLAHATTTCLVFEIPQKS
jgi:hypothetical protein